MPAAPHLELDPAREQQELSTYLGADFELALLQRYEQTLDDEFEACGDEQRFYRTSRGYLYNLTAFAMTRTKMPYLEQLTGLVVPGARILDYGCGIGSDGLVLLEAGYAVEFADFDNPSTAYLRWRLEQRGLDAVIHDLDRGVPGGFDATYAFDVIEHVAEPFSFLREMEQRARLVAVNLLAPEPDEQHLHHELPIRALLAYAARHSLRSYRRFYGRSHLVMYEPTPVGALGTAANLARLVSGRLAAPRR